MVVGLLRSDAAKLGNSPPGDRGLSITGLRRPWLMFRVGPRLALRRVDERRVPWRDSENAVLEDTLPGLLASGWNGALGEGRGLRRNFSFVFRLTGCWKVMNGLGLRRCSDGERLVRKLCDLAFRILAGWCLECDEEEEWGSFSRC